MDWVALQGVTTLIGTIAAISLAIFALGQFRAALNARYDAQRPILAPVSPERPDIAPFTYDANASNMNIEVRNLGPGAAFNVEAVLFPSAPNFQRPQDNDPRWHSVRTLRPFMQEEAQFLVFETGGLDVRGADRIADRELWAPYPPTTHGEGRAHCLCRMTLTYWDVFNRKHASIFDLSVRGMWQPVVIEPGILADLSDLNASNNRAIPRA